MYNLKEYFNDYYGNKVSGTYIFGIGDKNKSKLYRMFIFGRLYNSVMSMSSPQSLIDHDKSILNFNKIPEPIKEIILGVNEQMEEFKEIFFNSNNHHHLEADFEKFLENNQEEDIQKIVQDIKSGLDIFLRSISNLSNSVIIN